MAEDTSMQFSSGLTVSEQGSAPISIGLATTLTSVPYQDRRTLTELSVTVGKTVILLNTETGGQAAGKERFKRQAKRSFSPQF